jgi:hypothetical protein
MPKIVPVYRTFSAPKKDAEGQPIIDKDGKPVMEKVVEEHSRYALDAREAVRNGRGEWSMVAPKDINPVHVHSDFDGPTFKAAKKRKTIDD